MVRQPVGRLTCVLDGSRVARLRDNQQVMVPFTATFTPDDADGGWPIIDFDVDEHSGSLVVTRVALTASREWPIQSSELRVYSLAVLTALAARDVVLDFGPDGTARLGSVSGDAWESIVTATRARTGVGRERLEEVAQWFGLGGVPAVKSKLNVSRATAYRLIKLAREGGYIGEVDG